MLGLGVTEIIILLVLFGIFCVVAVGIDFAVYFVAKKTINKPQ